MTIIPRRAGEEATNTVVVDRQGRRIEVMIDATRTGTGPQVTGHQLGVGPLADRRVEPPADTKPAGAHLAVVRREVVRREAGVVPGLGTGREGALDACLAGRGHPPPPTTIRIRLRYGRGRIVVTERL